MLVRTEDELRRRCGNWNNDGRLNCRFRLLACLFDCHGNSLSLVTVGRNAQQKENERRMKVAFVACQIKPGKTGVIFLGKAGEMTGGE